MRRVAVTGIGIVSSIGANANEVTASLREAKSGISFAPVVAPPSIIRAIIDTKPMQGGLIGDWWEKLGSRYAETIDREVKARLVQGLTKDQIVRKVPGAKDESGNLFSRTRREADAIVRTAVNDVSAQVREATYEANTELVKGVQIVATLDLRTTPICRQQDGKVYPVGVGPRNPFHWKCRTTTISVLK